jgi:hypothetical protein
MIGFLITMIVALSAVGFGARLLRPLLSGVDPALRLGVAGLVGLGSLGTLTFFLGLIPGGFRVIGAVIGILAFIGIVLFIAELRVHPVTVGRVEPIWVGGLGILLSIPLVGVLVPSDSLDWDSLAYHLAVPKIWLAAGQWQFVSFIHHSNFPFAIDNLYLWGLSYGGQTGAKGFSWIYLLLGLLSLFGFARMRYDATAGYGAALSFASIPMVLWLSGTGYIDVSHGFYAGLGIAFAAVWVSERDSKWMWLSAIFLGLALGSKYTALQTLAAVGFVVIAFGFRDRIEGWQKQVALGLVVAVGIGCPWYFRNTVTTGNPVYPFFYSQLGGINWDSFSERIYREEQQTFGVGRDPLRVGHSILGLAYQPGRYINPGPTQGTGVPMGALGAGILATLLLWTASGKMGRFETVVVSIVLLSLGIWFLLSQQSRYIVALAVPLAILSGGAVRQLSLGKMLSCVLVFQAAYSVWLLHETRLTIQLPVLLGRDSSEDYQRRFVSFYEPAQSINQLGLGSKVALYDEVFGYYLDIPYFWANPGHTTEIPYAQLEDGSALVSRLKDLGITHVYLNFSYQDRDFLARWLASMGMQGERVPLAESERAELSVDPRTRWKLLLGDAVADGLLVPKQSFRNSLLFEVR